MQKIFFWVLSGVSALLLAAILYVVFFPSDDPLPPPLSPTPEVPEQNPEERVQIEASALEGTVPFFVELRVTGFQEDALDEYTWDMGDGAMYQGNTIVTHTYTEPGTYEVYFESDGINAVRTGAITLFAEADAPVLPPVDDGGQRPIEPPPLPTYGTITLSSTVEEVSVTFTNNDNGIVHRETSPGEIALPNGTYRWTASKPGFAIRNEGQIRVSGRPRTIDIQVEPVAKMHRLTLTANVEGALIRVRNIQDPSEVYEETSPATFLLPPASYSASAEAEGFTTVTNEGPFVLVNAEELSGQIYLSPADQNQYQAGRAAYEQDNIRQAVDLLSAVDPRSENYESALLILGTIYWQEEAFKNNNRAIELFEQVVELNQTRYEAYFNLASLYLEAREFETAGNYLNRVKTLIYQVPADQRASLIVKLEFLEATMYYEIFDSTRDTREGRNNGLRARRELIVFKQNCASYGLEDQFSEELAVADRLIEILDRYL